MEQQTQRIESLYQRLQSDLDSLRDSLRKLESGEEHQLPPNLSQRITEWTRTSRHLRNKTEDYKERLESMEVCDLPVPLYTLMYTNTSRRPTLMRPE